METEGFAFNEEAGASILLADADHADGGCERDARKRERQRQRLRRSPFYTLAYAATISATFSIGEGWKDGKMPTKKIRFVEKRKTFRLFEA